MDRKPVRQLRLVVEAEDFGEAVSFYRDVLGLPEQAAFAGEGDAQVVILDAGRATLEIANPAQKRMIDDVEVGRQVAGRIRVAFEVDDTVARTVEATAAGATELAPPTRTPWNSLNSRLEAPAELQITLFQELAPQHTVDLHRLVSAFDEAESRGDTDSLDALLAEDFRSIGEQGFVLDKGQWLGKFAEFSYESLESSDIEISDYGHAAVVRCVQRSRSTWRGQPMALTVRVSQTWVELAEGWRLAGIQFSALGND